MKIEEHAEADAVGGKKLRVLEMPQHLLGRGEQARRTNEALLRREQQPDDERARQ